MMMFCARPASSVTRLCGTQYLGIRTSPFGLVLISNSTVGRVKGFVRLRGRKHMTDMQCFRINRWRYHYAATNHDIKPHCGVRHGAADPRRIAVSLYKNRECL
ncbi:MAG: hypothetical protein ABIA92_00325 [Patescibacteria group bacterium]